MSIPRVLHQTWKDDHVPTEFVEYVESWRRHHPDWDYRLWTDDDNRDLIARDYAWFLPTYDSYPAPIQRADAARYFILHKHGGVYVDLDFVARKPLDGLLGDHTFVVGVEPPEHSHYWGVSQIVCNAWMAAEPSHPFLTTVINRLPDFVDEVQCGQAELSSTGPMMLTRVYDEFANKESMRLLPSQFLYPLTLHQASRLRRTGRSKVDLSDCFAIHHFYGTWWKPTRRDLRYRLGYTIKCMQQRLCTFATALGSTTGRLAVGMAKVVSGSR